MQFGGYIYHTNTQLGIVTDFPPEYMVSKQSQFPNDVMEFQPHPEKNDSSLTQK